MFAEITWRATRGGAQRFDEARAFWLGYYTTEGNRPEDYDLLLLVEDGDRVVSVLAINLVTVDIGCLFWLHFAYTEPEYQGRGVLRIAMPTLASVSAELPSPTYAVCRTLNPGSRPGSSQVLSPTCDYDPTQFVIRGFFSEIRHLIGLRGRVTHPPAGDAGHAGSVVMRGQPRSSSRPQSSLVRLRSLAMLRDELA